MKLYVSGPMSNIGPPSWNHPAFHRAAAELRCAGYQVISPAELDDTSKPEWDQHDWSCYLRRDVKAVADCDGIVMLDGWEYSKGANLEWNVAKALGLKVFYTLESALAQAPNEWYHHE
jgi:hypothetical protein